MSNQNDLETIQDKLERGIITLEKANVEMVRAERFRIITNRVPMNVRKALNKAVKLGELGHTKKSKSSPEVYFHPAFEYVANAAVRKRAENTIKALASVCI